MVYELKCRLVAIESFNSPVSEASSKPGIFLLGDDCKLRHLSVLGEGEEFGCINTYDFSKH